MFYTSEKPSNANREYGTVFVGKDPATAENVTELLIAEGLVTVREGRTPELQRLAELEAAAKSAGKGKWSSSPPAVSRKLIIINWELFVWDTVCL